MEYNEVLTREKFGSTQKQIDQILNLLHEKGRSLYPTKTDEKIKEEKDIIFYEIVLTARTVHPPYLITGNTKDFQQKSSLSIQHKCLK